MRFKVDMPLNDNNLFLALSMISDWPVMKKGGRRLGWRGEGGAESSKQQAIERVRESVCDEELISNNLFTHHNRCSTMLGVVQILH
jgi:hypothetical protein